MDTLLLDVSAWDLCIDAGGNIAMASKPYALAQDAGSAIRVWRSECWYDTTKGIPYFQLLGQTPIPLTFIKTEQEAAALTVPEVTDAAVFVSGVEARGMAGQVQVTDVDGEVSVVGFSL